ncbi:MAG: CheB methylesterase domain-containing protein [Mariprofundaceae bacterium]
MRLEEQNGLVRPKTLSRKQAGCSPDIIAIGSSTGGPSALYSLFSELPANLHLPVVVTQHMPAQFLQSLMERMERELPQSFCLAEEGMVLEKGRVHLAPGGMHLEVVRSNRKLICHLSDADFVHDCRPAVDPMFFSLAKLAPITKTLAVILTGMGKDGAAGAVAVQQAKGYVIAQDEHSSVVWGMPGAAVRLNAVDKVMPLSDISACIVARCAM